MVELLQDYPGNFTMIWLEITTLYKNSLQNIYNIYFKSSPRSPPAIMHGSLRISFEYFPIFLEIPQVVSRVYFQEFHKTKTGTSADPPWFILEFLENSSKGSSEIPPQDNREFLQLQEVLGHSFRSSSRSFSRIFPVFLRKYLQEILRNTHRRSTEILQAALWDFLQEFLGNSSRSSSEIPPGDLGNSSERSQKFLRQFFRKSCRSFQAISIEVTENLSWSNKEISPRDLNLKNFLVFISTSSTKISKIPPGYLRKYLQKVLGKSFTENSFRSSSGGIPSGVPRDFL